MRRSNIWALGTSLRTSPSPRNAGLIYHGAAQTEQGSVRDLHHHLVQMPAVAWRRATPAQPSGDHGPELKHPTPHRFVGEVEPALGEQILHVAVAQGEAKVEPNRVLDNRRRKAVAAIREQGHGERLSYPPLALTPFP